MSKVAHIVKVKPRSVYNRNKKDNLLGTRVLPNARKTYACREDEYGEMMTGHTIDEWNKYKMSEEVGYKDYFRKYSVSLTDTELVMNIVNEQDLLKYRFLLSHAPEIAKVGEETSQTLFVIYDEEQEAEERNSERENKIKAFGFLGGMTEAQRAQFLRLYGFKTDNMTPAKITDELSIQIEKDGGADDFIAKYEAKDKNERILLKALIQHEIVSLKGMSLYFGTDLIGASEDLAVEFLKDPKNAELKANFVTMLNSKKNK